MKTKLKHIIGVAALMLAAVSTQAQSNFVNSVEGYFTSFNTNIDMAFGTNVSLEAGIGYKQITGEPAASTVDAQYDFQNRLNAGAAFQFDGVGSAVNEAEAQIGYGVFEHYDTKVDADLRAGYSFEHKAGVVEPLLSIKKKLTSNTYAETAISFPIYTRGSFSTTPTIFIETGFTF